MTRKNSLSHCEAAKPWQSPPLGHCESRKARGNLPLFVIARLLSRGNLLQNALIMRSPRSLMLARDDEERAERTERTERAERAERTEKPRTEYYPFGAMILRVNKKM